MAEVFVDLPSKRIGIDPREDIPHPDFWLHNPRIKIETPLDERGLVDFRALVAVIKSTVDPSYDWLSPFDDRHHLQWPRRWYEDVPESHPNPAEFRHLEIGRVLVPRYFHNWVHLVTEPPPLPAEEVMRSRIEAQRVAVALFKTVSEVKQLARRSGMGDDWIAEQLSDRFEDYAHTLEVAANQPSDFHLVDYRSMSLRTPEDMNRIAGVIARSAIYPCGIREIRQTAAA